jgi:hypothetical protein
MGENDFRAKTASIFISAAAYIRRYGWQQKGMGIYGQSRCSMGALASAQPGKWDEPVSELAFSALSQELHGISLTQFNHQVCDGESVAQLYERVAAKLIKNGHRLQSVN